MANVTNLAEVGALALVIVSTAYVTWLCCNRRDEIQDLIYQRDKYKTMATTLQGHAAFLEDVNHRLRMTVNQTPWLPKVGDEVKVIRKGDVVHYVFLGLEGPNTMRLGLK